MSTDRRHWTATQKREYREYTRARHTMRPMVSFSQWQAERLDREHEQREADDPSIEAAFGE